MKINLLIIICLLFSLSTGFAANNNVSQQIQLLNSQIQTQLQKIQEAQQNQLKELNQQIQLQLKQMQQSLQDEMTQLDKKTQTQIKEVQEHLFKQIIKVQQNQKNKL